MPRSMSRKHFNAMESPEGSVSKEFLSSRPSDQMKGSSYAPHSGISTR